jgi:hypothetical protein
LVVLLVSKWEKQTESPQGPYVRQMEIDPNKYYPADVDRPLITTMPTSVDMLESGVKAKMKGQRRVSVSRAD